MKTIGRLAICVGTALWLAAAPGCGEAETGGAFEDEVSAIRNGTNLSTNLYGVVAVYHTTEDSLTSPWYVRPCTGTVLNPSATNNYLVLTARHCITPAADGEAGTPMRPVMIKVTAEVAPGSQPPANAVAACEILATPVPYDDPNVTEVLDMAIVRVCKPIPGLSATATPLFFGISAELLDTEVVAYGYGNGNDNDSSSGRLRWSRGQVVDGFVEFSPGLSGYDYNDYHLSDGTNGAYLTTGDSGGPSFWDRSDALTVQIGVHTGDHSYDTAVSRITTQWIQSVLSRVYIRPHDAMNRALTRSGNESGATVNAAATSGIAPASLPNRQWLVYEFSTRHIKSANAPTCLRRNSDNTLQMASCSTATSQKWWVTIGNRIQDNTDTLCLQKSGTSGAVVAPCSSSTSQKWYFDPDSRIAGTL